MPLISEGGNKAPRNTERMIKMNTVYKQHVKKVMVSFLLIAAILFGTAQLFFNENISNNYIPENTSISSVVKAVQKEKNNLKKQLNDIEKGFNSILI